MKFEKLAIVLMQLELFVFQKLLFEAPNFQTPTYQLFKRAASFIFFDFSKPK